MQRILSKLLQIIGFMIGKLQIKVCYKLSNFRWSFLMSKTSISVSSVDHNKSIIKVVMIMISLFFHFRWAIYMGGHSVPMGMQKSGIGQPSGSMSPRHIISSGPQNIGQNDGHWTSSLAQIPGMQRSGIGQPSGLGHIISSDPHIGRKFWASRNGGGQESHSDESVHGECYDPTCCTTDFLNFYTRNESCTLE